MSGLIEEIKHSVPKGEKSDIINYDEIYATQNLACNGSVWLLSWLDDLLAD